MKRRIFVGLGLDEESRRGVAKVMKMLGRKHWPVRWEAGEKWHVTLAFLGEIDEGKLEKVVEVTRKVSKTHRGFRLAFKGLGAFPNLQLPYSVWMSVVGDLKSLHGLRKELVSGLEMAGFVLDGKQFVPHVTLGRVKREAGRKVRLAMGKEIGKLREMKLDFEWQVTEVGVFESKLRQEGSKYEVVERLGLRV